MSELPTEPVPLTTEQRDPEFPVEQWMRDAKPEEIEEGTSDMMRLIISRSM
ncbi:acyl-CoA dehydrogenase family protein [Streptomyces lunaelactis]|uniref:acyl-CoA dehydrogenase family protein n=1 Tax=Streptomyces lunaelactis TaxID=1535768 RepID=UPI0020C81429|nr:acyl-CoA dehydrogenase family protein [Streptomyces lunaelactis]